VCPTVQTIILFTLTRMSMFRLAPGRYPICPCRASYHRCCERPKPEHPAFWSSCTFKIGWQRSGHASSEKVSWLRDILAKFRESLAPAVPKMTALLSNKRSDTQILLEVLSNLLKLAKYRNFLFSNFPCDTLMKSYRAIPIYNKKRSLWYHSRP
jgi:hypothetical protein